MPGNYGNRTSTSFEEQLSRLIFALKSQKLCVLKKSTNNNDERHKRLYNDYNIVDGRKLDQIGNKTGRFGQVIGCDYVTEDTSKSADLTAAIEKAKDIKDKLKNFCFKFPQENKSNNESVSMTLFKVKSDVKNQNDKSKKDKKKKQTETETSQYKLNHMYFVLDTNVLIDSLELLEDVIKLTLFGTVGGVLYLPYIVIKELDTLKCKQVTSYAARRAIEYLNDKFDDDLESIEAQSALEESNQLVDIDNADDSIINCCLQLKKEVPHMMLLTNDKNLRLKARASSIMVSTCLQLTNNNSNWWSSDRDRREIRHRRPRSYF